MCLGDHVSSCPRLKTLLPGSLQIIRSYTSFKKSRYDIHGTYPFCYVISFGEPARRTIVQSTLAMRIDTVTPLEYRDVQNSLQHISSGRMAVPVECIGRTGIAGGVRTVIQWNCIRLKRIRALVSSPIWPLRKAKSTCQ